MNFLGFLKLSQYFCWIAYGFIFCILQFLGYKNYFKNLLNVKTTSTIIQ
jgi:hypothetical protein